jgi:8-oxo-dGTP diphosphatase
MVAHGIYIMRGSVILEIKFYEIENIDETLLSFAVIASRYMDKWVWCKNKVRKKWEMPGGRREKDEPILETAKRELYEETGAIKFNLTPICVYSVKHDVERFGMLYFADIIEIGNLPESEIEKIDFFQVNPKELSFPLIQPILMERVKNKLCAL